jgi:hypothetical protein
MADRPVGDAALREELLRGLDLDQQARACKALFAGNSRQIVPVAIIDSGSADVQSTN